MECPRGWMTSCYGTCKDGCVAVVTVAGREDLVAVAAATLQSARVDRTLAEARAVDALRDRTRALAREREAEFAYERACRADA